MADNRCPRDKANVPSPAGRGLGRGLRRLAFSPRFVPSPGAIAPTSPRRRGDQQTAKRKSLILRKRESAVSKEGRCARGEAKYPLSRRERVRVRAQTLDFLAAVCSLTRRNRADLSP